MSANQPSTVTSASVLTQALLERCRERAPRYDRDKISLGINLDEQPRWG